MRTTIFDTPGVSLFSRGLAFLFLKIFGWHLEGQLPSIPKFVLIAAPHTSNWDLPVMLSVAFAFKAKIFWMGKDSLFHWPFGFFCRWLGGIPVDRSAPQSIVSQSVQLFFDHEQLILAVAPEGSRKKVRSWKTGFYHIANGAEVPIAMGFIDYRRKLTGIGPVLMPTGDLEADMKLIQKFYSTITAKFPEKSSLASVTVK